MDFEIYAFSALAVAVGPYSSSAAHRHQQHLSLHRRQNCQSIDVYVRGLS